ncbi:MAG: toll/interleukin-1 receptor domain-containing protein [Leifsonia xyli]|nr:MAG: toll/interleukin-1 receptor domain-containing protein [Leifsonia xyli]
MSSAPPRDVVLITHANPEDNAFSRWLAARLCAAGYKVWVDLRSLRGGEDFWDAIDRTLRTLTIKQVVVVSPYLSKPGVKKELAIGDAVGRTLNDPNFMIPIRVAEVDFSQLPPELIRRNSLNAFPNWADCLKPLLETLQDAGVAKHVTKDGSFLSELVQAQELGRLAIEQTPERLWSNWFPIDPLPDRLRLFGSKGTREQFERWLATTNAPFVVHSGLAATFCDPATFQNSGAAGPELAARFRLNPNELLAGRETAPFVNRADARKNVVNLVRQHWDTAMVRRGLQRFDFAAGRTGWFFPDGLVEGRVKFVLPDGRRVDRAVSGKFKDKRWHLCLVARPMMWPQPIMRLHANMALSLDGRTPLPGEQTHRLRMRLTKSWWNDKWRDLLLAGVHWIAGEDEMIDIAAGEETFGVARLPLALDGPVSYRADEARSNEEDLSGEIVLDDDLDIDDFADDDRADAAETI